MGVGDGPESCRKRNGVCFRGESNPIRRGADQNPEEYAMVEATQQVNPVEAGADPLTEALRHEVRGWLETMLREELAAVLGRGRHDPCPAGPAREYDGRAEASRRLHPRSPGRLPQAQAPRRPLP